MISMMRPADKETSQRIVQRYGLRARDPEKTEYWACEWGMIGLEEMRPGIYEIVSWVVHEPCRRQGRGGSLLTFALREAIKKEAAEIYIATDTLGVYEKVFGFELLGDRTAFRETEKKVYVKRLH